MTVLAKMILEFLNEHIVQRMAENAQFSAAAQYNANKWSTSGRLQRLTIAGERVNNHKNNKDLD